MNVLNCAKAASPIRSCGTHSHSSWEIILHTSGEVVSIIGSDIYRIVEGDIMVIPPGVPHDGLSEGWYTDIYVQAKRLDFFEAFVVHDFDGCIQSLFNMLHKTMAEQDVNYSAIADQLLETICQYIKKFQGQRFKHLFVNDFKKTIYQNLSNPDFSLSKEIARLGFSGDYFRRCFKEELGQTPLEYLTRMRIDQGKMLLVQSTFLSVEDVAAQCGFRDSFYFSTCFKKHVGLSPLQYRKQLQPREE